MNNPRSTTAGALRLGDLAPRRRPTTARPRRPALDARDFPTLARWLELRPSDFAAAVADLRALAVTQPTGELRAGLTLAAQMLNDLARRATR